jgi:predicted ABC-type sugar transport system permease subunit
MASIINLNSPAHYVHWHFFLMSVPNLVVIALMLVVFCVALWLRAPGAERPGAKK